MILKKIQIFCKFDIKKRYNLEKHFYANIYEIKNISYKNWNNIYVFIKIF